MKSKLTLAMCLGVIAAISIAAFAANHHQKQCQQDPNQTEPNQATMHRPNMQEMMEKRIEHMEKMIEELTSIRQTAQSENATKTVAALDAMIGQLQTTETKMKEKEQQIQNQIANDANQPAGSHRFHRGFKKFRQSDPNQAEAI